MAIDFPNSPSVDQTYSINGKIYKWDGEKWNIVNSAIAAPAEIYDVTVWMRMETNQCLLQKDD